MYINLCEFKIKHILLTLLKLIFIFRFLIIDNKLQRIRYLSCGWETRTLLDNLGDTF